MNVSIITATQNPVDIISLAAGTSYDKTNTSYARVKGCVSRRHTSVLEHAVITFRIDGVSRSLSHQLVRHRLASFVQQSQRYVKIDVDNSNWYVTPHSIESNEQLKAQYDKLMTQISDAYQDLLDAGCKAEDARYVLPNACKTNLTMTMNAREFFSFLNLRLSPHSQAEIRGLAEAMEKEASDYSPQWKELMDLYEENKDLIL